MNNTLGSLNNYLFESLERLSDDNMTDAELGREMERAKAIGDIASKIIANANIVLQAQKLMVDRDDTDVTMPKMLEG